MGCCSGPARSGRLSVAALGRTTIDERGVSRGGSELELLVYARVMLHSMRPSSQKIKKKMFRTLPSLAHDSEFRKYIKANITHRTSPTGHRPAGESGLMTNSKQTVIMDAWSVSQDSESCVSESRVILLFLDSQSARIQ